MAAALMTDFVFAMASAFATSFPAMLALRAAAATGVGAVIPVVFSYWSEFLTPDRRSRWLIFLAMSWFGGAIVSCGLAWALVPSGLDLGPFADGQNFVGWRVYLAACSLVSLLGAVAVWGLAEESPRWSFCAGRPAESARALAAIRRGNHPADAARPAAEVERRMADALSGADDEAGESAALLGRRPSTLSEADDAAEDAADEEVGDAAASSSVVLQWLSVYRGSFFVPSTLLSVLWFAHSFSFYGIVSWLPQMLQDFPDKVDTYANVFLVAVLQMPGSLLALALVPVFGAHRVLAWSLAGAGVSVYLIMAAKSSAMGVAMSGGYMALGTCAWNTVVVTTTGEYPTRIRSTAWGILSALGRLGAIAGTLTFGHLGAVSKAVPLTAVCGASLLASMAVFALESRSHFAAAQRAGREAHAADVKQH